MASILAFSPMMTADSAPGADAADRAAICPGCHTAASMAMSAVIAGASWRCTQCAQRWDADRLTAVANYAAWDAARTAAASVSPASSIERPAATVVVL